MAQAHLKSECVHGAFQDAVTWTEVMNTDSWLSTKGVSLDSLQDLYNRDGFAVVADLLMPNELSVYQTLYDKFLSGAIDSSAHRHDLGSHAGVREDGAENICQIMWPSDYIEHLSDGPLHQRALLLAQALLGDDVVFDFDMLIFKPPLTNTEVPPHQDRGYWPNMPDKRALSIWVAMDDATEDNGCMGFAPGSHRQPMREHRPVKPGLHVLQCDYNIKEEGGVQCPIRQGSCTLHDGNTIHFTGGNTTITKRRAYIVNFRPKAMVEWTRAKNFDHGRAGVKGFDYSTAGEAYKVAATVIQGPRTSEF